MIDFHKPYDQQNFKEFLSDFLPEDCEFISKKLELDSSYNYFVNAKLIANVDSLHDLKIVEIEHNISEKKRITITKDLFKLLKSLAYNNALVITYSKKEENYRFSLITSAIGWITEKSVKREFSNPKRLSFLLGPDSKIHTPTKQLIKLGKVKKFQDLNERFNIEVVNDEFFKDYKNLYLYLKKYLDEDKVFSNFAKKIKLETSLFAKKLLGQIVFCYFLQKKGWLGVKENKKFGFGDQSFLRNKFELYKKNNKNFFNDFLEYFFYEGLNNENKNDYVEKIKCKVPYIGGGLFEYYEGYDWEKETLQIPNKTFSNNENSGILDIFDLYNFTVDENEDLDIEISVDPEMLGRVFENLLEENIKKQAGTFYTPRVIVNYMSEETIINFLINKLKNKFKHGEIENFVRDPIFDISKENNFQSNAEIIDKLLYNIKICDPAVGSGAFAVSLMNLVTKLRLLLKNYVNRQYKSTRYYFKKDFVQNNIYGVDIDDSAVEITRLRLWLSLIVDEENYSKTEPLPNLDFKIVQGNSLIETFEGISLGSNIFTGQKEQTLEDLSIQSEIGSKIKKLADLQSKFLSTFSYLKKQNIKGEIENAMIKIFKYIVELKNYENPSLESTEDSLKKIISSKLKRNFFPWGIFFADIFYSNKGFDIVIANPPYINTKEIDKFEWRKDLEKNFGFVDDLYSHFTYLATYLAKDEGIISFITSDTFMTLQTKKNMRNLLLKYTILKFLTTPKAFSAMVDTAIFFLQKKVSNNENKINFINLRDTKFKNNERENKLNIKWEKALKPIFENINYKSGIYVSNSIYKENLNSVIFNPNEKNLEIREKIIPKTKEQFEKFGNLIKTSRDIKKNKKEIDFVASKINEGDITLLGLVTEGGQGLATGNNGDFIGCLENTYEANGIIEKRAEKIFHLIKKNKNFTKKFKNFEKNSNLSDVKKNLNKLTEFQIRDIFKKIKEIFGRDIFGQGFLYKVISKKEIIDENELTDKEKLNGINNNQKIYIKYDKGDKQGNRWFINTPYYIKWDTKTVSWLLENSGKKGKGMPVIRNQQYYFQKGFCWSDVHTTYLKCRENSKSVYDVTSMTLFCSNSKIIDEYIICLINTDFISQFTEDFLNNTAHFQINDARKLPIVIPSKKDLLYFKTLFEETKNVQIKFFNDKISEEDKEKQLNKLQDKIEDKVKILYKLN